MRSVLVTGGAGFIGSHLVAALRRRGHQVLVIDNLSFASDFQRIEGLLDDRTRFRELDIRDSEGLAAELRAFRPDAVVHLAAETHVDRSIDAPDAFFDSNARGTYVLARECLKYWSSLEDDAARRSFRFLYASTDEVYGATDGDPFRESDALSPSSPYSASKAAGEMILEGFQKTYDFPVLITRPSNTYGPSQFPEKLIPLMISKAMSNEPLPVFGDGRQVREWLYVSDHCDALIAVLDGGRPGEKYNIAGTDRLPNLDLVRMLCSELDRAAPRDDGESHAVNIAFVADRPGHDRRYAIDGTHCEARLGWRPGVGIETGMKTTVSWYLANETWWRNLVRDKNATARRGERAEL